MPASAAPALQAEAIVAGTLCLMSCYAQQPVAHHAERIAQNLADLAHHRDVTPELRTLCRRLAERWDAIAVTLRVDRSAPARAGLPRVH